MCDSIYAKKVETILNDISKSIVIFDAKTNAFFEENGDAFTTIQGEFTHPELIDDIAVHSSEYEATPDMWYNYTSASSKNNIYEIRNKEFRFIFDMVENDKQLSDIIQIEITILGEKNIIEKQIADYQFMNKQFQKALNEIDR